MAKIDLSIPALGSKFVDLRDSIPGDSFNFSWTRPLQQVKYLAIHHTAAPDTQTPNQIANFHINNNGWGGIGYHFLIAKDGVVFYVGDISTARANVANLNEQVLGICLIGNFISGRSPADEQLDSAHKLCDFFINNYPALPNVNSWDGVRGHKELPGQSTTCPGDRWPEWRPRLVAGSILSPATSLPNDRRQKIIELYKIVLGREPDERGLQTYLTSPATLEEILRSMATSEEHQRLLQKARDSEALRQQVLSLESVADSQKVQIEALKNTQTQPVLKPIQDNTFTLVDALANLYKFLFPAQKVNI